MPRVLAWLRPPSREAGPRAGLVWVRRIEILGGLTALVFGLLDWSQGWWHWLLIGFGLLGLAPWWGVGRIVRRTGSRPEILNHDAERGYHRARRFSSSGSPCSSSAPRHSATPTVAGWARASISS